MNAGVRYSNYQRNSRLLKEELRIWTVESFYYRFHDVNITKPGEVSKTRMAKHFENVTTKLLLQHLYHINHCFVMKDNQNIPSKGKSFYKNALQYTLNTKNVHSLGLIIEISQIWKIVDVILERMNYYNQTAHLNLP